MWHAVCPLGSALPCLLRPDMAVPHPPAVATTLACLAMMLFVNLCPLQEIVPSVSPSRSFYTRDIWHWPEDLDFLLWPLCHKHSFHKTWTPHEMSDQGPSLSSQSLSRCDPSQESRGHIRHHELRQKQFTLLPGNLCAQSGR